MLFDPSLDSLRNDAWIHELVAAMRAESNVDL
jgi:hypothetical protein